MQEPSDLVTAVATALAGVRKGQNVLVLGHGTTLRRALEAGTGVALVSTGPADVVVALKAFDVADAVDLLRPGGRLVSLAADLGAVTRTAERHGLTVQHTESVEGRTAWSAVLPT